MFNKLRNRFLIVNLVIISCIMLLSFATIYFITYQNVRADIDMDLHRVADFYLKPDGKKGNPQLGPGGGVGAAAGASSKITRALAALRLSDRSLSSS